MGQKRKMPLLLIIIQHLKTKMTSMRQLGEVQNSKRRKRKKKEMAFEPLPLILLLLLPLHPHNLLLHPLQGAPLYCSVVDELLLDLVQWERLYYNRWA
ncbi:unnamed protein product [Meloidogyne enterolobii]|uniref:Uncharacterized protein n=1 Tax=Meloidogyne enterolobii TaxID=390850 RepID=A0ACB1B9E3_MELEN